MSQLNNGCMCIMIDGTPEGGVADARSCPEHAYEAGRRHERNVYLEERAALKARVATLLGTIVTVQSDRGAGHLSKRTIDAIDEAMNGARTSLR
jgi:hypothetical protein